MGRRPVTTRASNAVEGLDVLGLQVGEAVRWRPLGGGRWRQGTVTRRERDGSIGVTDAGGATRSIAVERLEVRSRGPRRAATWEPLTTRASRCEQLTLL